MKILRIIYDFPPPWSGLAPFPYEITKAQAELGHNLTVICGLWPNARPKPRLNSNKIRLIRIIHEPLAHTLFFTTAPLAGFISLKEIIFAHYDVIIGHGQLPFYYHIFRLFTQGFWQPPYYLVLHITAQGRRLQANDIHEKIGWLERLDWRLHELSDKIGVKVAQHIFVTGENTKQEVQKYYGTAPDKITVLENGVDTEIFTPRGVTLRKSLGFNSSDFVLLYVGVHNSRKGISTLIQMLTKLPGKYKLLTVGGGNEQYLGQLNELIIQHELQDRVKMIGPRPYPLPEYYRSANVFVLPSSFEGFPKVILESLACGVPVIASGFAVNDPPQGLYIIKNPTVDQLVKTIDKLAHNPVHIDQNLINNRYSWKTVAENMEAVINP